RSGCDRAPSSVMSVPPQGPEQARPDQPAGPSRPGGPVPPAPGGQQPPQQQPPQRPDEGHETARRRSANRIIDTSSGRDDGLNKCPRCGSAEIQYSLTAKALVCAYCRHSWNEENAERAFGLDSAIAELRGHTMASGTQDVRDDLSTVTLKCQGCGAAVAINVDQALQARCQWCRQPLSIGSQIANGAVPDAVPRWSSTSTRSCRPAATGAARPCRSARRSPTARSPTRCCRSSSPARRRSSASTASPRSGAPSPTAGSSRSTSPRTCWACTSRTSWSTATCTPCCRAPARSPRASTRSPTAAATTSAPRPTTTRTSTASNGPSTCWSTI